MSASVLTFGCRLNAHESDGMAHHARGQDDTIIVNTCAVTTTAERQARQAIRRAHRENPDAKIVVTGCASDIAPDRWAGLPGVVRVVPNEDKLKPAIWGDTSAGLPPSRHARALLQVQQGCDHRCTFCIIPYGRGDSRSTPVEDAIARAEALVEAGHQEIVLTGVDIASWQGSGARDWARCVANCCAVWTAYGDCACLPSTLSFLMRKPGTRICGGFWKTNPA